ncbi:Uncharacterized protein APZ42_019678 [Daphnia magna]|uniref:Uncharacterized protein n=1 Tax=Daphnia magna TaxID=35525 RepID=A0A162CNV7_9CRUS|nr:Uncharacterized protein APZ42_019678 [Daphnia magna]
MLAFQPNPTAKQPLVCNQSHLPVEMECSRQVKLIELKNLDTCIFFNCAKYGDDQADDNYSVRA